MWCAADNGHLVIVQYLVKQGVDIDWKDEVSISLICSALRVSLILYLFWVVCVCVCVWGGGMCVGVCCCVMSVCVRMGRLRCIV